MRAHRATRPTRTTALAFVLAVALLAIAAVGPVSAAPPERVDEPIFLIFPDFTNGYVVFWNTTREAFCAWEAAEFEGDPPALQLVTATYHQVPSGPIIFRWAATGYIELWAFDADADFSGPCADTDDQTGPFATGTAHVSSNDNDLDHDASVEAGVQRSNAFGERGQGSLIDGSGMAWAYSWVFHVVGDNAGEFRVLAERAVLHPRG